MKATHSPKAHRLRIRPKCFIIGNFKFALFDQPVRLTVTAAGASPHWDTIFVVQIQNLISFLHLRSDDDRFSIDGYTRASYSDGIVRFDVWSLFLDVPTWSQMDPNCFLVCLQCKVHSRTSALIPSRFLKRTTLSPVAFQPPLDRSFVELRHRTFSKSRRMPSRQQLTLLVSFCFSFLVAINAVFLIQKLSPVLRTYQGAACQVLLGRHVVPFEASNWSSRVISRLLGRSLL